MLKEKILRKSFYFFYATFCVQYHLTMKVFFTGSPRALKDYKAEHVSIYKAIENLGHRNLSDYVITADPEEFYNMDRDKLTEHYDKMIDALKSADIMVVESTLHSMSMGFLVEKALNMSKPVIILYLDKQPTMFISGLDDEKLQILQYTKENILEVMEKAFEYAAEQQEVRFNFFISPSIGSYLDWISKVKKIPRSVYLRALIEREMRENKEYNKGD